MKNWKSIVVRVLVVTVLIVVAVLVYSNRENFKRGLAGQPEVTE
jgi:hypothetical protein